MEKRKASRKLWKISFWISLVVLVIGLGFWLYNSILFPAYLSTAQVCYPEKLDALKCSGGFVQAGEFRAVNNGTGVEKTISLRYDYPDQRVAKHEWCHNIQYEQGRLFHCGSFGAGTFIVESECYVAQRLPKGIYEKIYGAPGV